MPCSRRRGSEEGAGHSGSRSHVIDATCEQFNDEIGYGVRNEDGERKKDEPHGDGLENFDCVLEGALVEACFPHCVRLPSCRVGLPPGKMRTSFYRDGPCGSDNHRATDEGAQHAGLGRRGNREPLDLLGRGERSDRDLRLSSAIEDGCCADRGRASPRLERGD